MPVTQIDPVAALIIIDLQKGIVAMPTAQPVPAVVHHAAELARAFRQRKLPVVLVNVAGPSPGRTQTPRRNISAMPPDWTEIVPELDAQPTDHRVTKHSYGAFLTTDLEKILRSLKVTQIVLAGISTSAGVESTARSAFDLGYNVVFATDAMTDAVPENHTHDIEKVFPRLGELDTTTAIIAKLS